MVRLYMGHMIEGRIPPAEFVVVPMVYATEENGLIPILLSGVVANVNNLHLTSDGSVVKSIRIGLALLASAN